MVSDEDVWQVVKKSRKERRKELNKKNGLLTACCLRLSCARPPIDCQEEAEEEPATLREAPTEETDDEQIAARPSETESDEGSYVQTTSSQPELPETESNSMHGESNLDNNSPESPEVDAFLGEVEETQRCGNLTTFDIGQNIPSQDAAKDTEATANGAEKDQASEPARFSSLYGKPTRSGKPSSFKGIESS